MPVEAVALAAIGWVVAPVIGKVIQNMMDNEESKPPSLGTDQTTAQNQRRSSPGPETHIVSSSPTSSSISLQRTQDKPSNSKNNLIKSPKSIPPLSSPSPSGSSRTTQKQRISPFQAHINDEIQKLATSYYDINKSKRRIKDGEREKHVALSSSGNHERVEQKREKKGETNKRRRSESERMTSSNPQGSMLPKVNGKHKEKGNREKEKEGKK